MKKLNNKGFAISSLLYGLMLVAFLIVALIMSTMSTNRKNTSTLIKKIEEELNRYSQTTTELTSTDGVQEFIVPYGKSGWYKIELWGAAAKNIDPLEEKEAGRGAYTSGIIYLEENTHLYFFIGSKGGSGSPSNTESSEAGGATDVRLIGGQWDNVEGKNSRLMIAAGGFYNSSNLGTGYGGYYVNASDGGSYISGYAGLTPHATYKFINTIMLSSVNSGEGKAKIELISTNPSTTPPAKKTNYLNNVRTITNCVAYITAQSKELWREIVAIDSTGTNVALGKPVNYSTTPSSGCSGTSVSGVTDGSLETNNTSVTSSSALTGGYYQACVCVDLGGHYNLEEITFYHDNPVNSTINSTANYSKDYIKLNETVYRETPLSNAYVATETYMGLRISDRNPDIKSTDVFPTGNYYIQSMYSDRRFLEAGSGPARMRLFTGNKDQRWSVTPVGTNEYKILDGIDQMALQPRDGGLEVGEPILASSKYNDHAWEKWSLTNLTNGYYLIKSLSGKNLCLATPTSTRDKSDELKLKACDNTDKTQWFKFINADY